MFSRRARRPGGVVGADELGLAHADLGGTVALVGLVLVLFAVLDFILAWGIWKLRRRAWWLTMITAVLSILGSLSTLAGGNLTSIPAIALDGITVVVLLTSNVRQAFGVT